VFSPYYAAARRRGPADPARHVAVNLALYGAGGHRWAMTERGPGALARSRDTLAIGPSRLAWHGDRLEIEVDEIALPWPGDALPGRLRGRITLRPEVLNDRLWTIDAPGRHVWGPIAPSARVDVELSHPGLRWSGHGYFDHNAGTEPLERGFRSWTWSRAAVGADSVVLYDTVAPSLDAGEASGGSLALRFKPDGSAEAIEPPPRVDLPRGFWRVGRSTRADQGAARVARTLEDTPFYMRSELETRLLGCDCRAFHESLSLQRFATRAVQLMLPFRMPRRG
jgi:carotenoid 1,2-hydratase